MAHHPHGQARSEMDLPVHGNAISASANLKARLVALRKNGAQNRNRTDDLRVTKPSLYQLSYLGTS